MSLIVGNVDGYLEHVSTADEAARLDDDLSETIAHLKDKPGSDARVAELKAARRKLQGEYPEILERAFGETADGKPRPEGLGPRARGHKGSGDAVTRTGRHQPKRPPRAATQRRSTRRVGSSSGRRRRGGGSWFGSAVEQTGVPGAARSVTANTLELFGVLIGLSLAYLLLSNAQRAQKGRSAVELISKGIATGVSRVVSADPAFGSKPPTLAADTAAGVAAVDQAAGQAVASSGVQLGVGAVARGVTAAQPKPKNALTGFTSDVVSGVANSTASGLTPGSPIVKQRVFAHPNRPNNR